MESAKPAKKKIMVAEEKTTSTNMLVHEAKKRASEAEQEFQ